MFDLLRAVQTAPTFGTAFAKPSRFVRGALPLPSLQFPVFGAHPLGGSLSLATRQQLSAVVSFVLGHLHDQR